MSSENQEEYYSMFFIDKDSISIKQIFTHNYWIYNETVKLPRINNVEFRNDILKAVLSKHNDKISLYRNDSLVQSVNLKKITQFQPDFPIDKLKDNFEKKLWKYNIGELKFELNFIDENTSFNVKDTINNTHLNYFDIFTFGTEQFLIPDTDNPTPIQIISYEKDKIKGKYYQSNISDEITINVFDLPKEINYLKGNWLTHIEYENDKIKLRLKFSDSHMVETFNEKSDTLEIQVLSDHNHIAILSDNPKPYKIRIYKTSNKQIEVLDYRRRNSKNEKLLYNKIE